MTKRKTTSATIDLPAWRGPDWAQTHELDDGSLTWGRVLGVGDIFGGLGLELLRVDRIAVDDRGAVTASLGDVTIHVIDDVNLTPAQARTLAAGLVKLAERADGAR